MAKLEANLTHVRKGLLRLLCVAGGGWCVPAYVCETVSRKKSKWGGSEHEKEPRARQDNHDRSDCTLQEHGKEGPLGVGPGWGFLFVSLSRD